MADLKTKSVAAEAGPIHRVRITLTSRDTEALESVCSNLKQNAERNGLKGKVSGPVRLPTKVLHITTRKTPCGEGSKTWDRLELRIHKRIIDFHCPAEVVHTVTAITVHPSVNVEVNLRKA